MRIGFLGIQCDNPNLGVSALAYAGVNLVDALAAPDAEFVLFSDNSKSGVERMRQDLRLGDRPVRTVPFRHRSPRRMVKSFQEMRGCDLVLDFTGGDSFSDIYGKKRLLKLLLHKQMVLVSGTALVLGPQTYGPFASNVLLPWVRHVVNHAEMVFSRDKTSADYLRSITEREVRLVTDVAVTLPWTKRVMAGQGVGRAGFNVSGLLWNGGYTGDNQFALAADYRAYCRGVISGLLEEGFEVELVAHVVPNDRVDGEGELAACRELQAEFPLTTMAPPFSSPVEAKAWISGTDVFIGARMHATIAAFTSGVPTVPAAYSRKFAGFFGSLGYDVLVDLTTLETQEAISRTLAYVMDRATLGEQVTQGVAEAQRRIAGFSEGMSTIIGDRVVPTAHR